MKLKQRMLSSTLPVMKGTLAQIFLFVAFVSSLFAKEAETQSFLERKGSLLTRTESFHNNTIKSNADITISGYVLDDTGLPLPGASVMEKGTKNGASTNDKGFFSLKVKDANSVLVIKSVGFTSKEITVGAQTSIKVSLKPETSTLADVVVVGYGTQKKVTATGSISSVGTKELVQSPAANISNSLVGRLPGLFASQAGGEPGNDQSKLRIRGVGTFTGNTDPLVLVDGIQVPNYNNIDPNEIETLTILKDASATAVYGIRGANGVLLITTKRGKVGKPTVSYSFNRAVNSFTTLRDQMNSYDYARYFNIARSLDNYVTGANLGDKYSAVELEKFRTGSDPVFYPNTNWYDLLLKKSSAQSQHNINVRGGQEKVTYFISAGLFNQEGLFADTKDLVDDFSANSTYKRYNFRSNFNFQATKRFKVSLDASSQTENLMLNNSNFGTSRIIADIARASPVSGPGYKDGKIVNIAAGENNPFISLLGGGGAGGLKREYRNNLNGSLKLDHTLDFITKGLASHSLLSYQTYNNQLITNQKNLVSYTAVRDAQTDEILYLPNTTETNFTFGLGGTNTRTVSGQLSLDYQRSFGGHNVTGLILYDQQKTYDPNLSPALPKGYQNLVSRVTYNYKSKYLVEFNGNVGGTENFAPGKRFGFFPAGSIGWVPTEEAFFPKNDVISFLKVRASLGVIGNDNIGGARFLYSPTQYAYVNNMYYWGNGATNYTVFQGLREGKAGNPNVTWESAVKTNIGTEATMFHNTLKLTFDLWKDVRDDILANPSTIPVTVGIIQPASNFGKMSNKGFDGDITYTNHIGNFDYRIAGNYSFARNKILFQDEVSQVYAYRNRTGHRFGQYYGLIADGIYSTWEDVNDPARPVYRDAKNKIQPGDLKFRDVNGDGIINDDDQVPIGYSNIPEKTYGFSLYGKYKGFDFSVLFQGVGNVSLAYTRYQRNTGFGGAPPEGNAAYLIESWTPERQALGLPINFPRLTEGGSNNPNGAGSTFFTVDASYLRLKNMEVGYSLNQKLIKRVGMSSLRLFVTANNLVTWSKVFKGIDPENLPSSNINEESYPLVRTINAGVNVNF